MQLIMIEPSLEKHSIYPLSPSLPDHKHMPNYNLQVSRFLSLSATDDSFQIPNLLCFGKETQSDNQKGMFQRAVMLATASCQISGVNNCMLFPELSMQFQLDTGSQHPLLRSEELQYLLKTASPFLHKQDIFQE